MSCGSQRLEKILQDTGIKLTSAFSTVGSASLAGHARGDAPSSKSPCGRSHRGQLLAAPYATLPAAGGRTRRVHGSVLQKSDFSP